MKDVAGGLQWTIFLIASSIAAPIAIAHAFGMNPADTAFFVQRTIFVLGAACLVQAFFGHRMPINEGPAGLWWGIYVVYAGMVGVFYTAASDALQALQSGMLYSGILFILLAAAGVITKMKALFTPAVTCTYLLLLILQLSGTFIKGMIGVEGPADRLDPVIAGGSLLVLLITFIAMGNKRSLIAKFAILLSILFGWILFLLLGKTPDLVNESETIIQLPQLFVYGKPVWDSGILVTSVFITILLIANMLATIRIMENLFKHSFKISTEPDIRQSAFASGINHLLAGVFSAIGPVPISAAAGFVSAARMPSIKPFIIGSSLTVLITFFPGIMSIFAALPAPVAYAVSFAIFTKLVTMAFSELDADPEKEQSRQVLAFGLMFGVGSMFVPVGSLSEIPPVIASVLSNGLIVGTIIAILIEQFLLYKGRNCT